MPSRDEVEMMILSDLAAICTKLADNPIVPGELPARLQAFIGEYDSLLPNQGTRSAHFSSRTPVNSDIAILAQNMRLQLSLFAAQCATILEFCDHRQLLRVTNHESAKT
jgi:hypothetical protein